MEEPQKIVDVMDQQQLTHNQFESDHQQQQNLLMQSNEIECIITERQRQWQETIDPQNLVVDKVIGHGSEGVVYKGSYKGQTVAGT